ncbi:MAG TPA: hypothetical protein VHL31_21590 [Geminicoccus sp.]|uniref:hypothetical protein n=1 Tax=Geminicoccus sp. TaxID=2024832 RepID=UPI002E337365|nr:hypothetical protein [Geminicoccus sp.]HEX2528872.1 hypothetical protein [Geminicoccus sp.]
MSVPLRQRLDLSATLPRAGTRRVLLHATSSLAGIDEVRAHHRGIDAYDQRALLIAGADDLVVTHGAVDWAFTAYLQELRIGPAAPNLIELELDGRAAGLVDELLLD